MAHRPEAVASITFSREGLKSLSSYWLKRGMRSFGSGVGTFAASNAALKATGVSERDRLITSMALTAAAVIGVNLVPEQRIKQIEETIGRVNRFMWFSN